MPLYVSPAICERYSRDYTSRTWYELCESWEVYELPEWSPVSRDDWDDLYDWYAEDYYPYRYCVIEVYEVNGYSAHEDSFASELTGYDLTYEEARAICDGRACSVTGP